MSKSTSRGVIRGDGREIIVKVIEACELEATNRELKLQLKKPTERAAFYTGVSVRTICRIRKENKIRNLKNPSKPLCTPGMTRDTKSICDKVTSAEFEVIRRTIEHFYLVRKQIPSCQELLNEVRSKIDFPYAKSSMRRLLKSKGFFWRKGQHKNKILMEKPQIVEWRCKYLRAIKKYKAENKHIYYLNETWIEKDMNVQKCLQREEVSEIHPTSSLVAVHAGFLNGRVQNANLVDYQDQMNQENLIKWLQERLFPNIKANSVIVLDNAAYNFESDNKSPNKYSTKTEMMQWLDRKKIQFPRNLRKCDLMALIEPHLPKETPCNIDTVIKEAGHIALRLPPYTCELNPIKLAWPEVKLYVRENNISNDFSKTNINKLTNEALTNISEEKWRKYIQRTTEIEDHYGETDRRIEEILDEFAIHVTGESSADSESNDDDDD